MAEIAQPFVDKFRWNTALNLQSEEVLDLRGEDGERDARGEAHHDGIRDELDDGAQTKHAQQDEKEAGHDGGDEEARKAELRHDTINNDDECTRRPTDLDTAAPQRRDDHARHDGGEDAGHRPDGVLHITSRRGGNGKGDGQRQRHDADHNAGDEVGGKLPAVVASKVAQDARCKLERFHSMTKLR